MSSASVQSTSSKIPKASRTSTRGTDSSTSSSRLSKEQITGSVRESVSSFPSERSSNVTNQANYSTRSCSQDNVPHSSTTSVSRFSTSRFASQTLATKTNSSISGFSLGQPTKTASEIPHFWNQASNSEPANVSTFVDTKKRHASNDPLIVSSSGSLEIFPTKHCVNEGGSRSPSKNVTCDRPKTVSHFGESINTYADSGKARFVKKSAETIVSLNEKGTNCSTCGTVDDKELSSALKESSSSCSSRLVAIPFGSVPIDIVVGCGISRDSGFLNRITSVGSNLSGNRANSSAVEKSVNCRSCNTDSSTSKSTSTTSESPFRERIRLSRETDAITEKIRVSRAPSSLSDISSCVQQSAENRCPENVPQPNILLGAPTSECSIDMDDSINTSSISNVHLSVSQTDVNRRKPLLHMTISSNSDVEFLFNRSPSEASTRTELSIVVKIPRNESQTEVPVHVASDSGSSLEQCGAAAVGKLYPVVSIDAPANVSSSTGCSAIDTQLSIGDPNRSSLDASGDDDSDIHRYVLRCQDRMVPSADDPTTQQMALVCTIEQMQCRATGENEVITSATESELLLPDMLQKELKSLAILQEDHSCSNSVTGSCCASVSHASSVSESAGSHLRLVGASSNPVTHTDNHNCGSPAESIPPSNNRDSLRNARAYFKELCSRYGYCSAANLVISDRQQLSETPMSKEKSGKLSRSAAKSDANAKTKLCFRSPRYVTVCSSKPAKSSTGFSNNRYNETKSDEGLCCKSSDENDLEPALHGLEEKDVQLTIKASKEIAHNMESSVSVKSESDSSDGSIRLISAPEAKSGNSPLMLRISLSISGSSLGSGTDGNIEINAEDSKKQIGYMNLLAFLSEKQLSEENLSTHFPSQEVSTSSNKLMDNSEELPAGKAKESYTEDRDRKDIASSVTQRNETDSERRYHQTSFDFDSDSHDDIQNEIFDFSDGYSQDERQIAACNDRNFIPAFKNANQQKLSKHADSRKYHFHSQKWRSQCFNDSPLAAETPTGLTPKDTSTHFGNDLDFTQRSRRKGTSIRTRPKRNTLKQSLHFHTAPLHISSQSDDCNLTSTECMTTTYDDYSSDGLGSNATCRSKEYDDQVVQIQNKEKAVSDNCGCKKKHSRSRNKPFHSERKEMRTRAHASDVDHERMEEHTESDRKVKPDSERKRKKGTEKNVFAVTDDNLNSVPEIKGRTRTKKQPNIDYSSALRNLRRRIDDDCGCLNEVIESYDEEGFQQRENGKSKGNTSDHDSRAKNSLRSIGTLRVQSGKEEQHALSNSIQTATAFDQRNTTPTILECNDWSSLDNKPTGVVRFGRGSSIYEANDGCPQIESVVSSSVADKKLKQEEIRDPVKKRRHKRTQNDRIPKATPEKDDCDKTDNSTSFSYQEFKDFPCSTKDTDTDKDRFLTTDNKEKSRLRFCKDFEVEVRKTPVVQKNELHLRASPSDAMHRNSDEAESDSKLKDELYFERLHKEFELVSAHQRQLDEFSLLGPECSALLREHDAQKLRDIVLKTKNSPPATYTRHHSRFHNQKSVAMLEEKTNQDLYQRTFPGGVDGTEDDKRRPTDATENEKNCFPWKDACNELTLKAETLKRKDRGAKSRRNRLTASRRDDEFSDENQKFAIKPNCSCANFENGYFSLPCNKEDSGQKLSNCSDWTTGRGAITNEEFENSSYLETWMERNFEPIIHDECAAIKDTPSYECSVTSTCGRRTCSVADFEMDAEEQNKCSYLPSVIVNPEITMNAYVGKDSRSKENQKTESQLQSPCVKPRDERGKPCDGRRVSRHKETQKTDSLLQYDCGKPSHQSQCRMIGATTEAADTGTLADDLCSTNYGNTHEQDQVKKKQRKSKSRSKASNAVSLEPHKNPLEILETSVKDRVIETRRNSDETGNIGRQTLPESLSEFLDDSKEKSDRKMSDREPAQPEEMLHKPDENEDSTKSKNDEDEDKRRGNENKFYSATDDKYQPDKNDTALSAAAIQVSNTQTHDYLPVQIPVETKQLHQTDETNDMNDGEQLNQQNSVKSETDDNKAAENENQVDMNDKKQDETKSGNGASNDDILGNTDNVLSTEVGSEMPISRHAAEDNLSMTTDESRLYSAVNRGNQLAGEEEIQVHNSLAYYRLPVQEPVSVSDGIALSYLETGEDKENSTVERPVGNLNSVGTQTEVDVELPKRNETVADDNQIAQNNSIPSGNSGIDMKQVDRSELKTTSDQTDHRGIRNLMELISVQPTGTDKSNSTDVNVNLSTRNLEARTDDSNFKETVEVDRRAGSGHKRAGRVDKRRGSNDVVLGILERYNRRTRSQSKDVPSNSLKRSVDEPFAPETINSGFAYGSRSLEEQTKPNIFRWPPPDAVDKHTVAGPISSPDENSHQERRLSSYDQTPDTATSKSKTAKKLGFHATLDSPRKSESKSSRLLSPMESFQKMLHEGEATKHMNKNLMLSGIRRYTDHSQGHALGLLSGTSTGHVVNHENPIRVDVSGTEDETPKSSPEQIFSVMDYSKHDLSVEVPVEEPMPDDEHRTWKPEASDKRDPPQDSTRRDLNLKTEKKGSEPPYEIDAEASKEGGRQEEMKTEDPETAKGPVAGFEPTTPEYSTLKELDWVARQLLRCRRESEKLVKDKSMIQLKLRRLKEPQTPTGDAKKKLDDLAEEEEEEEEEEEKDAQQLGFSALQDNDPTTPTSTIGQLSQLRRRLERCQEGKEFAQQQKQAAQLELDKLLQTLPDMSQQSSQSKKNDNNEAEVKGQSSAEFHPAVARRPFYYTVMRVTEADTCSRQFYSQVKILLTKLREERRDCSCGDDDFKNKMLWILWHQRQEAFRELGEWETLLRRMNIPAGTVRESLRQLQRQMDNQIAEINDYRNEIIQLRIQKMRMEQTMSEHIRQLVEDRWKHAVLVKTLRQRNEFLTAEAQSAKRVDESSEASSRLRDGEEIQSLRAEMRRLVASLKVTDNCFVQRCPANALADSGTQSDKKDKPEDKGFQLQIESSSNKSEGRAGSTSLRKEKTEGVGKRKLEEDLNAEKTKWLREKYELEKKLKFRDKIIDELTAKAKDRRGWPSFELADCTRSKEQTKTASEKPHKNSNRTEHRSQFKTPFSSRFNSEAQIDRYERQRGEKRTVMNGGGWSSPLLASDPPPLDKRNYRQKQMRVLMQPLNCEGLARRHLVTDSARASSLLNGGSKYMSLVDLDRDVESEYEALLGQRHPKDFVATSSTAGQLSEIVRRMEKLEALVSGQHLLLTVTRARMTSLGDDNEFLRQQLAALRRRTYCEPETVRENDWLEMLEHLARASNGNMAKDFSHDATSDV